MSNIEVYYTLEFLTGLYWVGNGALIEYPVYDGYKKWIDCGQKYPTREEAQSFINTRVKEDSKDLYRVMKVWSVYDKEIARSQNENHVRVVSDMFGD